MRSDRKKKDGVSTVASLNFRHSIILLQLQQQQKGTKVMSAI